MPPPTLVAAIDDACRDASARLAVTSGDSSIAYGELHRAIDALAGRYRELGIQRGDRIVCQLSNRPETLVAAYAAWSCGALHVALHHESTPRELNDVIDLVRPALLVYEPPCHSPRPLAAVDQLLADSPDLRVLLVTPRDGSVHGMTIASLLRRVPAAIEETPAPPSPDDAAAIFLTSGTTGRPKTPLGFQGRLARSWSGLSAALSFGPDDVHLIHLPLAHGFGLMLATAGLLGGGRVILLNRFASDEVLDVIAREQVTVLHGSATHFRLLLQRLAASPRDVRSLRIGVASASAFSPSLLHAMRDALQMDFMVMYGSSEGVGVATLDPSEYLGGSVGRPDDGAVAIVNEQHEHLPDGAEGEIAFSRAHFPVTYWTGDSHTGVEEVSSGWFYTGDLGRIDDGQLFVLGRLKHQINRGGSKIDPLEVENAVLTLPGVAEAAVLAVPHPVLGEAVCACVVPGDGWSMTLNDLRAALRDSLAPYKLPDDLRLLDRLPRTALGKVDVMQLSADLPPVGMASG
ncbi:MAG TPA: class I adenylate-forming enzyme family protein [Gemmatimonadaceae bacterium]|nr:class I adenylate-forming enzyme family protein [Gemmatimonadaceae bacterium]